MTPSPASSNTVADKWGNKGSILASQTWGSEFGILGGFAWGQNKVTHHRLRDHRLDQPEPLGHAEHVGHAQQHRRRQLDHPGHRSRQRGQRPDDGRT